MKKPDFLPLILITAIFIGVLIGFILARHSGNTTVVLRNPLPDETITSENADTTPIRRININTATADQLAMLPGIGENTAEKIVQYRNTNGMFVYVEDLLNIKGFGKSRLSKIQDYITVEVGE